MKFIELTSSSNNTKIKFKADEIVGLVDHNQTQGDEITTMSFVWLSGMQEPFSVSESVEVIIDRMKEIYLS